jgi:hypothetical protein
MIKRLCKKRVIMMGGALLIFPILIYGTFTSSIYWRDHMDKEEGRSWLITMIIMSLLTIEIYH